MTNFEHDLRMNIKHELSKVTIVNSPNVWKMIHTECGRINQQGYQNLEKRIIDMVIAGRIPPAAIIPQIESELEVN